MSILALVISVIALVVALGAVAAVGALIQRLGIADEDPKG